VNSLFDASGELSLRRWLGDGLASFPSRELSASRQSGTGKPTGLFVRAPFGFAQGGEALTFHQKWLGVLADFVLALVHCVCCSKDRTKLRPSPRRHAARVAERAIRSLLRLRCGLDPR